MRSAIIKQASQKEQQNQTTLTTTTNIKYIQSFCPFFKKNYSEVKIASDKNETKQNNFYFFTKDMGLLHNNTRKQLDKKEPKNELQEN